MGLFEGLFGREATNEELASMDDETVGGAFARWPSSASEEGPTMAEVERHQLGAGAFGDLTQARREYNPLNVLSDDDAEGDSFFDCL